jgi:hypothetical protein
MKCIQVYDPPMASAADGSGAAVDRDAAMFSEMLAQFRTKGIAVERHDFVLNPQTFAQNKTVKVLLERLGLDVLPVILWDGTVQLMGRYPTKEERLEWLRVACGQDGREEEKVRTRHRDC